MTTRISRGFTLVELAAVVCVGALVAAQVAPMGKRARNTNRGLGSSANLMQIGQGAGMYGLDNAGLIPTYTAPGRGPDGLPYHYDIGGGETFWVRDTIGAAAAQQTEILRRRTGRYSGEHKLRAFDGRLWHRRWVHLVLMDYLGGPFPSNLFIDPSDSNQLVWASNPLEYNAGSTVPYANGIPLGHDQDGNWTRKEVRNRWAFATSYLRVPASWVPDGVNESSYHPIASTPHLFGNNFSGTFPETFRLNDGRQFSEVRFPTAKVYMFEEFDREQAGQPYFGYDQAACEKLMFDGSVNSWASGDANASWNPDEGKAEWRQFYLPIDTFPIPLGGLGDQTLLSQRYRWTLGGLTGVDYPMPLMPGIVGR